MTARHALCSALAILCLTPLFTPLAARAQGHGLVSPDGTVDWNRYYTAGETEQILRELAVLYPGLTELYSIGKSFEGRDLWVMEVTDEQTGAAADKPALYLDGGIHAGELTGSAVALYTLGTLLQGYGRDAEVADLLGTYTFYIRPKFNPDGSDLALIQDQLLRSTVRPWDEDEDGTADEDPPEDLDGDGWITMIRLPDPEGAWYALPEDPRIMIRAGGEGGGAGQGAAAEPSPTIPDGARRYRLLREGSDNDGDGSINEDGIGGIDMNRNFPRNWEREHLQAGAGPFPLSEPETYATAGFVRGHPNIVSVVHGHTSGGFVYRLPSASAPSLFPENDLMLIEHLGTFYTRTTGRPVRPSATHPTRHRYGTLITWAYWDHGVVGWVPEYSPGPESWVTDYDGDGDIDSVEEMRFNDEELGGRYFSSWSAFDHPDLGPVEIGGWRSKFWGQNPPAEFLQEECRAQVPWILYLIRQAPRLELDGLAVSPIGQGLARVRVTVFNSGFLPTSLTERGAVGRAVENGDVRDRVVRPPVVTLELDGADLVAGEPRVVVDHLRGQGPFLQEAGEPMVELEWRVRPASPRARVRVVARSDKAGVVRSEWVGIR
jgi:murein tripeptide amidase MpaA